MAELDPSGPRPVSSILPPKLISMDVNDAVADENTSELSLPI